MTPPLCTMYEATTASGRFWRTVLRFSLLTLLVVFSSHQLIQAAEEEAAKTSTLQHNANGEAVITLDEAAVKRIGLVTAPAKAAKVTPEIKCYGRVLDPTPLAALATELSNAHITLEASRKELELTQAQGKNDIQTAEATAAASHQELERVKKLFSQNNASERTLQTAEATAHKDQLQVESQKVTANRAIQMATATTQRDLIALEAVKQRFASAWGTALSSYKDLNKLLQELTTQKAALIRLDMTPGQTADTSAKSILIQPVQDAGKPMTAKSLGVAPAVDPQAQGTSLYSLLQPNVTHLLPGMAVIGYLPLSDKTLSGALVPRAAVIRAAGQTWVYVETAERAYTRRAVLLTQPEAEGWFVQQGLQPADKIVITGAQILLSEELKSQIQGD